MGTDRVASTGWLSVIRRYGVLTLTMNLAWDSAHIPLYTIWTAGSPRDIGFAVLHCTAGDIAIASVCLVAALAAFGHADWPGRRYASVAIGATVIGALYTTYSEQRNLEVGTWKYSDAMLIIPPFDIGLSPLLQSVVIPLASFALARRPFARGGKARG